MKVRRSGRTATIGVVTTALVAALLVGPVVTRGALATADAAAGAVSGAIGLGGGLSGSVDERTGLFSVSVPVVSVSGPGSAGVTWSLVWDQGRAAGGQDRSGFGAGWSLGVSYVDTATPRRVYPANGGSFLVGGPYSSGLEDYPLKDLVFSQTTGANPYSLTYDDGRVDTFNADGNLVSRSDRFGNRTQFTWASLGENHWAPSTIVDGYGQTTTFTYTPPINPTTIVVAAPARSDAVSAKTTITLDENHRVASIADPNTASPGTSATFEYATVSSPPVPVVTQVTSPTQARTHIEYQEIPYQQGLTAVRSVVTADALGSVLGPARYFLMNPLTSSAQTNYTGFPTHLSTESDALFASGDPRYQYTTALNSCVVDKIPAPPGCAVPQASTQSTYDSKHRLVTRNVSANRTLVQTQTSTYSPVQAVPVPGNYARPLTTTITYQARSSVGGIVQAGRRTTSNSRAYDDHGRVLSSTDETGTTTLTTYDGTFGLVTGETVTGKDGSRRQTTRVLTADKKSISSGTTAYASPGQPLRARVTTSYLYDTQGQPSQRTMTWAPGAKPSGNSGGPDSVITKFAGAVDSATHTRTITTTTAAETSVAASARTVFDLVTGQPVRDVDALGRVTSYSYDAGGRQTSVTTPDGFVTRRAYAAATGSTPATTTDSTPDGRIVLTTFDALGRQARVTDNVRNQAFTSTPTTRQVSAYTYSVDGTRLTATDELGRTVSTTLDALGRRVQQVGVTGITQGTVYDDGAHTIAQSTTGAGAATAAVTRTTGYDDGNRPVSLSRQYSDDTTDPLKAKAYDGLGRATSVSSDDLTMVSSFDAPGGISTDQTVTPKSTKSYPGTPLDLSQTVALGGQQTSSEREQATGQSAAAQGTRLTYDPAGRTATATDPDGRITSYTYYVDDRVATRTSPVGVVTTDIYDATSGRLTSVTTQVPGQAAKATAYTYIPAGQPGAGQVHTLNDGATTVTLAYDADHHVVSRSYSDGTSTSAAFRDNGLLASTTDVTGAVTSYVYDGSGRMTSAIQKRGTTVLASVGYTYDAFSRVATTTRNNGVTTTNTFDAHNRLTGQRTTSRGGSALESHAYTYDSHGNVSTRVDTVPTVSQTPTTAGTWTTAYSYDAYDRLVGSATYAGGNTAGQPTTTTTYTLSVAGDILGAATTTRTQRGPQRQDPPGKDQDSDKPGNGPKPPKPPKLPKPPNVGSPPPFTSTVTNVIDPAGQLTSQTTDGTVVNQSFDGDGRVTTSLSGATMTYDAFDRMATATTKAGTTATYAYWPDGTRRSTTTSGSSGSSTQTFHYGADRTLVNDTTADATTGSGATTASYLLTAGREARTLQPGTSPAGTVPGGAPAAVVTGPGTGYLLRDRHSSVTALVDATGAVTNSYEYADYGAAAQQDGQLLASPGVVAGGRTNPFQYTGAAPTSSMTDGVTALLLLPSRSYDPTQARFTSRDAANVFNHYQGFATNPIRLVDLTGHDASSDIFLDIGMALLFLVAAAAAVFTAGAAVAALPAIVEAGVAAETASAVVSTVASVATAVGTATGAVASTLRAADSIDNAVSHQHFLSTDTRSALGIVEYAAGAFSAVAGIAGAGISGALAATEGAEEGAADAGGILNEEPVTDSDEGGSFHASDLAEGRAFRRIPPELLRGYEPNQVVLKPTEAVVPEPVGSEPAPEIQVQNAPEPSTNEVPVDPEASRSPAEREQLDYGPQHNGSDSTSERVLGTNERTTTDTVVARTRNVLKEALDDSRDEASDAYSDSEDIPEDERAGRGNWHLTQSDLEDPEGWNSIEDDIAADAGEGSIDD